MKKTTVTERTYIVLGSLKAVRASIAALADADLLTVAGESGQAAELQSLIDLARESLRKVESRLFERIDVR